ncbi:gamma-crystallin N isoform X4 [Ailuropoda melanoleuca]|uniref:gamma-crystallin N isoform X4 n=1 Tax=Ailuropoda melanoleuca TaxID=9646 RepID=UPI0014941D37|nr:gamma-crystallin N isoform X4 [Ailuropoda melanoleuca]
MLGSEENLSHCLSAGNQIILYEGKHFTGRKLEVYGDCDNFQDRGFMNRVNSIRVESGAWVCFDHPDFRGQQFILEHGDYPDFLRWNGHNDHMGSCRPIGMHGENFRLEIFEGCNFTGQCLELQEDCPFLQSQGWSKNSVNAIKVYGDGAVQPPLPDERRWEPSPCLKHPPHQNPEPQSSVD